MTASLLVWVAPPSSELILNQCEQVSFDDGRMFARSHLSPAPALMKGNVTHVSNVRENLSDAEAVDSLSFGASETDARRPFGNLPQGIPSGCVALKGFTHPGRYILLNCNFTSSVSDVPKRKRPDNLALPRLLLDACLDSLNYRLALKFRKRPEDVSHHATGGRACINRFLNRDDAYAGRFKLVADIQKVTEVTTEAVEFPEDEPLEFAGLRIGQKLGQLLAATNGLSGPTRVSIDTHQLPTMR